MLHIATTMQYKKHFKVWKVLLSCVVYTTDLRKSSVQYTKYYKELEMLSG